MGGFSYRGRSIGDFGEIYYIPDAGERGSYALSFKAEEQEINGRDGAYYYGNRVEPREFELRCYYEGLTQRDKEDILHWFHRNTKGKLVFDDRDYVYYNVIPNRAVAMEDHQYIGCGGLKYKGIMTIFLKAYDPFGRLQPNSVSKNIPLVGSAIVDVSVLGDLVIDAEGETLILVNAQMPSDEYPLNESSFYIYNPGTERTPLTIQLAGAAESGTITNIANGTQCVVNGMTRGNTTDVGKDLIINSETGRVTLKGSIDEQLAFEMHDRGYIWLEPCTPFVREITVSYTSGSDIVTSGGKFREDMGGQFIWLNDAWRKIKTVNSQNTLTQTDAMDATGTAATQIVTMNEIVFDGFELSKLRMAYSPRMR